MSTETDQALQRQVAATCRPGQWARLRPLLRRLGLDATAGPEAVVGWLRAASAGSHHEAEKALRTLAMHPWAPACGPEDGCTLQAGGHAWRLAPRPAHRPLRWQVSTA